MLKQRMVLDKIGVAFVVVLAALIVAFAAVNYSGEVVFNPPGLRLILNTIFITAVDMAVAVVSVRSFLRYGQVSSMILASALVISGLAAFLSGLASMFSDNANFTIFNAGMFFSSVMQAFGAVYLSASATSKATYRRAAIAALSLVFSAVSVFSLAVFSTLELTAPFITESGTTAVRQFTVGLTFIFFSLASIIFGYQYMRSRAKALYWYSLALALLALDSVVSYNSTQLGDTLQWLGRIAYYSAGVYFIGVLFELQRRAEDGSDFSKRWFETFSSDRRQFASLFANMLGGFAYLRIVAGKDGNPVDLLILEINDDFEKKIDRRKEDVVGKCITQVIEGIEKDPAHWISTLGHVGLTGEAVRFENYMEGLQKWFRVSAYSPEKGYVVTLFEDVSERRKLQVELESHSKNLENLVAERTKQLKNAERLAAIGQTAGMVGHDIRNPLQAIIGDLYLIKLETNKIPDKESKNSAVESIDSIEENISYINKIISDLQDYGGKAEPKIEEVDLGSTLEKILSGLRIPENIETKYFVQPNVKLNTDPTYLRRILTNLAINSIQAMPKGGKLALSATFNGKRNVLQIAVSDTGEGIPKDAQDKLFKPLFTTKAKGQGFGLAVVKKLVEELEGTITFESEVGKGTKFIVELPIK